jgi:hypothetical protein
MAIPASCSKSSLETKSAFFPCLFVAFFARGQSIPLIKRAAYRSLAPPSGNTFHLSPGPLRIRDLCLAIDVAHRLAQNTWRFFQRTYVGFLTP